MGSTRLPGKVLMDLGGETTLGRVVRRLSRAKLITEVVIATTESPADDVIVLEAKRLGIPCFRGSELDVLGRYLGAAEKFTADVMVRVTSDCPLIDPIVADQVLQEFSRAKADFAYNDVEHGFPRGLDVEVFSAEALQRAWQLADAPHQREHVTPIFYERRDLFQTISVGGDRDYSSYRWTLDALDDLHLIRAIYRHFSNDRSFSWRDVIALMEQQPELKQMNANVIQKSLSSVSPSYA